MPAPSDSEKKQKRRRIEVFPTGHEEVFDPVPAARKGHAAHDQNEHQDEERGHEHLGDALDPFFDAAQHDESRKEQEDEQIGVGKRPVRDEGAEVVAELRGVGDDPVTRKGVDRVLDAPAAHRRIEGKDQKDRKDPDAAEKPPGLAADFVEASHRTATARATHGEFRDKERHAHGEREKDVGKHEDGAAVRSRHVGELPDGPETDRGTRAREDETEARPPAGRTRSIRHEVFPQEEWFSSSPGSAGSKRFARRASVEARPKTAPRRRVGNVERRKTAGKLEESGQEKGVRRVLEANSLR